MTGLIAGETPFDAAARMTLGEEWGLVRGVWVRYSDGAKAKATVTLDGHWEVQTDAGRISSGRGAVGPECGMMTAAEQNGVRAESAIREAEAELAEAALGWQQGEDGRWFCEGDEVRLEVRPLERGFGWLVLDATDAGQLDACGWRATLGDAMRAAERERVLTTKHRGESWWK